MCVCVCVERERERERERELYPFPDLPTPKYICQYSKLSVSVFSDLWLDYLACFVFWGFFLFVCFVFCFFVVFFLQMHHQSIKTKKKCQRTIFRQTCSISLWTPTPVSNVIPIVFSIPNCNSISAILNKPIQRLTDEIHQSVFALDSRQYRQRFNLFHFL